MGSNRSRRGSRGSRGWAAGIRHEDVESAEALIGVREDVLEIFGTGGVSAEPDDVETLLPQLVLRLCDLLRVPREEDDALPGSRERFH